MTVAKQEQEYWAVVRPAHIMPDDRYPHLWYANGQWGLEPEYMPHDAAQRVAAYQRSQGFTEAQAVNLR